MKMFCDKNCKLLQMILISKLRGLQKVEKAWCKKVLLIRIKKDSLYRVATPASVDKFLSFDQHGLGSASRHLLLSN